MWQCLGAPGAVRLMYGARSGVAHECGMGPVARAPGRKWVVVVVIQRGGGDLGETARLAACVWMFWMKEGTQVLCF